MGKFVAGALLSALLILGGQRCSSEDEVATSKDTITIKLADQTIEVPKDTFKKDSVR